MQEYKKAFIDFMLENQALKFGDFTLKSGRKSPFFMNVGSFNTGRQLNDLAEFYAKAIKENFGLDFDVLFGPAYKGIPLAVATAMKLYQLYGKEVAYCANRKEIKDHGDVGALLGDKLDKPTKVVIIEDVTTSGKSIDETFPLISSNPQVEVLGLIVSLDRKEFKTDPTLTALEEVGQKYGLKTASIADMQEVVDYLRSGNDSILSEDLSKAIDEYYKEYGVKK